MRVVELTERRTHVVAGVRADAIELRRRFGFAFDVVPGWKRGVVRVTPRGVVGTVTTAGVRWVVRPKLPADALHRLIDPAFIPGGVAPGPAWADALGDLMADRLVSLLAVRTADGLRADYAERRQDDAAVRGRIDFPQMARAGHPFAPVPVVADEFTTDVPWNQAPKAAARHLLTHGGLSPAGRARLAAAAAPFAPVTARVPTPAEWDALAALPQATPYRDLLAWSRVILSAAAAGGGGSDFLAGLEMLFQNYITFNLRRLTHPLGYAVRAGSLTVRADQTGPPIALRPDLVATAPGGVARAVFDVKWKTLAAPGPLAADVHQVMAYALAFGVRTTGLVYPGRRFTRTGYPLPHDAGTLWVVQMRLTGDPARVEAGLRWLGRRCVAEALT